jgi:mycothiol synthase
VTEIRPPRPDEVDGVLELMNAHAQAMWGENGTSREEVEQWFSFTAAERRVAVLPGGALAGFGAAVDATEDHSIVWVRAAVHPELGTDALAEELFAELDGCARERARPGGKIHAGCAAPDARMAAVYKGAGYELVRHFFRMVASLADPPPVPSWPDGIELRPFDPDRHMEAVYRADEEAFEDHWGMASLPYENWREMVLGPNFDPSLWFVAWDGDEIAGFSLCRPTSDGDPDLGWVEVLAVRRPWRRRGLALTLLLHSFAELRALGRPKVGLGVDAENLTGAVRLYERAGMAPTQRSDTYEAVA